MALTPFPSQALFWPMLAAVSASEATSAFVHELARLTAGRALCADLPAPEWASRNEIVLELPSMRLRDFSAGEDGPPTLICAPYALHGATVADFALGHSLVEALRAHGRPRVAVTDWRSASPEMRLFSIDTLLADLNVAVDEFAEPVDLIGLCQGGWMALVYAARFPRKVRRLVIAGAPIDIAAGESGLSQVATGTPMSVFHELIKLGEGRLPGQMMLHLWGSAPTDAEAFENILQIKAAQLRKMEPLQQQRLIERFRIWFDWTVDLPGVFYLQVVEGLFKQNSLAEGRFRALGRLIDLAQVKIPVVMLAGRDDELVAPDQLFAAAARIGSPPERVRTVLAPCPHLGLFMGADTLRRIWPDIVAWLDRHA